MIPYDALKEQYHFRPEEQPFEWYVNYHMRHGFVFSTPRFFVMGLPVVSHLLKADVPVLNHAHQQQTQDTWYVSGFAGDISSAWAILPYPLSFVAFERDRNGGKELSILPMDRIKRLSIKTS